jgi:molecular chaperone GrpE (heat shock protein)
LDDSSSDKQNADTKTLEKFSSTLQQQENHLSEIQQHLEQLSDLSKLQENLEQLGNNIKETQDNLRENSIYDVMQDFLLLYDYVDLRFRSLWESQGKDHPLVHEVSAIRDRLLEILQRQSITPINTNDLKFDPTYHQPLQEDLAQRPEEDGQISRIFRQGFLYKNRVFRLMEVEVKRYRRH